MSDMPPRWAEKALEEHEALEALRERVRVLEAENDGLRRSVRELSLAVDSLNKVRPGTTQRKGVKV